MHVAKFWRTKKLRYRLVRTRERKGSSRAGLPEKLPLGSAPDLRTADKRVKVPA